MAKKAKEVTEEVTEEVIEGTQVEGLPATTNESLPAVQPFDDGLGEVTQEDLIIPRLRVGQKQSDEAVTGKLFIDITGDVSEEMELVLLKMNKGAVLWPKPFSRDSEPLCKSNDFIVPDPKIKDPMATTCAECAYSKWTKGTGKKSTPPKCKETWNFLVLDYVNYMPAWFSLKSTALKPARKIISMLKLRGTAKKIPCWGFKFQVTVEKRLDDSGDSYLPVFSSLKELEADEREGIDFIHAQLAGEKAGFDEPDGGSDTGVNDEEDF